MKKTLVLFVVVSLLLSACSGLPKLVKVEDQPDPTATLVQNVPDPIKEDPTKEPLGDPEEEILPEIEDTDHIIFFEPFDSDNDDWETGSWSGDVGYDEISGGEYRMTISTDNYMLWSTVFNVGTPNVIMEVDSRLISGDEENGAGFVCRYSDPDNFYYMFVGNDGYYSIDKFVKGEYENLIGGFAEDGVVSSDLNRIKAVCDGEYLSIWANDYMLDVVVDYDLTFGDVGLFGRSYDEPNITFGFDNFTVIDADDAMFNQGYIDNMNENVLYYDDFEYSDSGVWDLGDFHELNFSIEEGWLTYDFNVDSFVTWDVTGVVDAENVLMEAYFSNDAEIEENLQGFVCRYQDNDNFYFITFGNDGYILIGKYLDGERLVLTEGYDEGGIIEADFNLAHATCANEQFRLVVNNELVAEVEDTEPMLKSGDVGFLAGSFADSNVKLSMDDFVVLAIN